MARIKSTTLHRSSLARVSKEIKQALIDNGTPATGLGTMAPYNRSVGVFFKKVGIALGIDMPAVYYNRNSINNAIGMIREAVATPPPPVNGGGGGQAIDMDDDGNPDTVVAGTPGDGNPAITQDVDSFNVDNTGDGKADIVIDK
jgi:hypothetical protein